ncbi:hypothetical protein M5D96_008597 [Drosophila gunungcola]|uniref:C-type lectin domain-containing protein n=1 Tax=Drosophila gunungcola TaxID=103775 RepID=A0A9Q0BP63_9MUSC|nr:hypothetical protein M5D96_008597 [Drosophila gunungcola]
MFIIYMVLTAALGLPFLDAAFRVRSTIDNGIPKYLNFSTSPFVKIGAGYYYFDTKVKKNWFDAAQSCHRKNAHLVAFETVHEWDLVNRYIFKKKLETLYWTDGTSLANKGKHYWFSIGDPITANIWYPGEPNFQNGNEFCDEMGYRRTATSYLLLNDRTCDNLVNYICEKDYPKTASVVVW